MDKDMDKTDNKTEAKGDKSNRNKEGLPFTDSAIQKWLPGFSERGNPKFIEIPFNVKNIALPIWVQISGTPIYASPLV